MSLLEQMLSNLTSWSMWGFIGTIIALIFNLRNANSLKKKDLRAFVVVESTIANPYADDKILKEGGRLILTEEYKKALAEYRLSGSDKKIIQGTFIKIKNISSNHCFDMQIKVILKDKTGENTFNTVDVYVLEGKDELYIPSLSFNTDVYEIKRVEVEYKTIANEKMKYINQTIKNSKGEDIVKHSMHVRTWLRDREVVMTNGSSLRWEVIK
ncbi:hypothetical protein CN961_22635 [Bacillus thuringiensis]|uniref:hypothetical protein n=1 Tax=Bacillus thuringiensis TaxID=1428 RepID=UPI000BFCCB40|nr:hypothetical protein [Bacillus thuringiensis]PGN55317.1 hypothetical protein CN961_22635 [Bacillus thuringiensis]